MGKCDDYFIIDWEKTLKTISPDTQIDWHGFPSDILTGFKLFHAENPHIYTELVEMAYKLKNRGRNHGGMKMLFEVLRWNYAMRTQTNEPFKLNNNYTAFYVRLIESQNPGLKGFFIKRSSMADSRASGRECGNDNNPKKI